MEKHFSRSSDNESVIAGKDLGAFLCEYTSEESKFNMWWCLLLLIPMIGFIILFIIVISYFLRKYPIRFYRLYEKGFTVKKGKNNLKVISYDDVNFIERKNTKVYAYGFYRDTEHYFALRNKGKSVLFIMSTRCRNENDLQEKNNWRVRLMNELERLCSNSLMVRVNEELRKYGKVVFEDEDICIGDGYIVDKNKFTYYVNDIGRFSFDGYALKLYHKDYQDKVFNSKGHTMTIDLTTNMRVKVAVLQSLLRLSI